VAKEPEQDVVQEEVVEEDEGISEEVVCEEGAPGWVVTFGDMMSLLLTFFILLLSFATLDKVQFNKLSGVMKEGFGSITRTKKQRIPKRDTMIRIKQRADTNSRKKAKGDQVKRLINQISGSDMNDQSKTAVEVFEQHNQVKVLIPADDVFVTGTEQIRPRFYPMLNLLAVQAREVMADKELSIEVRSSKEVKCDPSFFRHGECDYWLLTGYQAVALSNHMQNEGQVSASKIIPVGRGISPAAFVNKEERQKKKGSTVEFIYVTPPQKLMK
jgi:chemotaxis protein MotB